MNHRFKQFHWLFVQQQKTFRLIRKAAKDVATSVAAAAPSIKVR
jgi:hypothetical protein